MDHLLYIELFFYILGDSEQAIYLNSWLLKFSQINAHISVFTLQMKFQSAFNNF